MENEGSRKLKRRHLVVYLKVYDRDSNEVLGNLVDITTEGLMLIADEPFDLEQSFRLRLDLGEHREKSRFVDLDAVSKWTARDVNPSLYCTGFEFDDPSPQAAQAIRSIIQEIGFAD
jgi:hypothetical protein